MENCKHNTHHDDCCVCWFKQSNNQSYPNDIPLFMHKMSALLMNKDWRTYCLDKALGVAKSKVESNWPEMFEIASAVDKTKSITQKVLDMRRHGLVI